MQSNEDEKQKEFNDPINIKLFAYSLPKPNYIFLVKNLPNKH